MDWSARQVRALRQALRLGQEEFAEQIGAAARTVRNWESGQNQPGLALQRALDRALHAASEEQRRRFTARVENAGGQFAEHVEESGNMDRQEFLRALLAAGGTAAIDGPLAFLTPDSPPVQRRGRTPPPARGADPRVIADYAQVTAGHRRLYWSLAPAAIIGPATAHAVLGLHMMSETAEASRERLAVSVTEALLLVGRIEFFDLRRAGRAWSYLRDSADCAAETGQAGLKAAVTAHRSFVPAFAGYGREATAVVAHALAQAANGVSATTQAWLHAVEAEARAHAQDTPGTLRALGLAEDALEKADPHDDPEWLDFFDQARLDGFKGYAYLAARRPDEAREVLTRTLDTLPGNAGKQRAVTLADLAAAHVQQGEIEAATQMAEVALQATVEESYATAADRLVEVRAMLDPFSEHRGVRELDEHLRLAGVG